jgi:hypothetical protein
MMGYIEKTLGHKITFEMANSKINLSEHDEWLYDNIIYMAPSMKGRLILLMTCFGRVICPRFS